LWGQLLTCRELPSHPARVQFPPLRLGPAEQLGADVGRPRAWLLACAARDTHGPSARRVEPDRLAEGNGFGMTTYRATVAGLGERDLHLPQWWSSNGVSEVLTPVAGVVPVLGAGVSRAAGLPGAPQLAEWLVDNAPMTEEPPDRTALFAVVDAIDRSQLPPDELGRMVAAHIESFPPRPTPFLEELVHLPSRFIVTLNYDDLVGFVAEQQKLNVCRLSALEQAERLEAHRRLTAKESGPPSELTVLHLHGQARSPQTLVLDDAAYRQLARLPEVDEIVFTLAHFRSLAFVGTTLNEVYLLGMLQRQVNAGFHVVFCRDDEVDDLTSGRAALSPREHLHVIGYPDHEDLIALSRWLSGPQPPRGTQAPTGTLDPAVTPDPAEYIPSEFDERAAAPTTVSEQDIREGQRTIVVGVAGTGKTHLLSWLAANAPVERPTVRIRLADVPFRPGRPEAILAAWAEHARSTPGRSAIDVSPSALREDRLHFLLDGLDEVANELQETAASVIAQVAARFPQHAFTVTSRPLPALTFLGYRESPETTPWRFVDLVPGAAWQQRYLDARGLTLAQLDATMPGLTDMRELLHIPFFLTRTVELYENGWLEGLRDVGELLDRLVDFALSREEELLPMLSVDDARAWLRRVALAAAIAGRRTFTFAELREVPVAEDLVGDLGELVQQLHLRVLLTEEDGRVRFSHRLLADELVAEALADLRPSDALLDALVPEADAQLAGVRDDLVIAVSLLCLRSPAWREAVGRRDPLAAARSTPSDATSAEQAAAVELLWSKYEEWGIWAWDRSAPDLVEDAEVIARLLRLDADGPWVAELRRLLHAGDEIQQGNAVRVLARVAPPGLTSDLRQVLRDPARNGVVIRQAAIAAADLGLADLIDDIVFAMLESPDSVVHQDGSIALRLLTPDDRLLDVAKRLVPCRDGNLFSAVLKERMNATDRIELARTTAVARVDVLSSERADLAVAASEVAPSPELVQAAACAATFWRDDSDEVKALLDRDPKAAALGLLEARDHGAQWWDLSRLAAYADLDTLRAAGVNQRVIEAAERELEFRAMSRAERDELRRDIESEWAREREEWEAERPPLPKLAELLRRPAAETDAIVQAEAFNLRGEVAALAEEDLQELRARLAAWWPEMPVKDLVTERNEQFSLVGPACAWLFLAPAAEMPVTDKQWAQLATNPLVHGEQGDWLRRQATDKRMQDALGLMTEMRRAKAWLRLLDCCPAPPPTFVAEACAASVETDDDRPEDTTYLMQRLVAGGITPGTHAWAARDKVAARAVRPMLAVEGELEAQRLLLLDLLEDVRSGRAQAPDELGWMSMLRAPEFLEPLFEILERVYPTSGEQPRSGWGVGDVLTPTMNAIATIGTREAVRRYDAVLARGNDLRWLRGQRDRIAADVLRITSAAALAVAAAASGVPLFPPVE
jgi:SIR2-like domain